MVAASTGFGVEIGRNPSAGAEHRRFVVIEDFAAAALRLVERVLAHLLHVPLAAGLGFLLAFAPPADAAVTVLFTMHREFEDDELAAVRARHVVVALIAELELAPDVAVDRGR